MQNDQQQANHYTCPMHPEVQQDTPGTCPKCGMQLVPQDQTKGVSQHVKPATHQQVKTSQLETERV